MSALLILRDRGAGDARERVVSSVVVEFMLVGGAVGLERSANSCAITREGCPGKWCRCGVTGWTGADCGGSINNVVIVDSARESRVPSSEGAVGGLRSANAHAESSVLRPGLS